MQVKFFNPGQEFKNNKEEYVNEWTRVREAGDLILRDDVKRFEESLAKYVGTKYAVGLNSGTDALLIALKSIGIKQGDKVLVPSHTFVATAQVVAQLGAEPVLYDLGSGITMIPNETKALIVAHIAGEFQIDDMETLVGNCRVMGIPLIEDACQALGATKNGKKAGSFGVAGAFSFYPAKILGGPGDGGALVTNDEGLYNFAIEYRNHWKKDYSEWGINSRLDNVLAAELDVKLRRIEETLARRDEVAFMYHGGLRKIVDITLPTHGRSFSERRVWQDYIIRTDKRDELYDFLKESGIETMKNEYPMPCGKLPNAEKYEAETLRLPINEVITDEEVGYVIEKIKEFYDTPNR